MNNKKLFLFKNENIFDYLKDFNIENLDSLNETD